MTQTKLERLIFLKETECRKEATELKEHFNMVLESFRPINLLRGTLKEPLSEPNLKTKIANTVIGYASGFLAKRALIGKTNNPITKLLGMLMERTIAGKITNNMETIKQIGSNLFKNSIPKKVDSK